MPAQFLQIHFLTSYPSALLNRDDAGFAKRIPFGGAVRTRISSQCLKRHWRTFKGEHGLERLDIPMSIRSRRTFEEEIFKPLAVEVGEEKARAATVAVMEAVLGKSAKAKAKEGEDDAGFQTGQVTVLGRPEMNYLLHLARAACSTASGPADIPKVLKETLGKEGMKNLQGMRAAAGLDAAMFGRMVTSDILARGDAAVHVAHAFTVHAEQTESDYFSAVDELARRDEELGSGHIGSVELTSGFYYGYLVVDVPLLVANLEGCAREQWASADRDLAARVVESLVHTVARVTPGAKLGSTAPYAVAHMVMVEAGNAQPRTFANAFLRPVRDEDLVAGTYAALGRYAADVDQAYGKPERRFLGMGEVEPLQAVGPRAASLDEIAAWAAFQVREG